MTRSGFLLLDREEYAKRILSFFDKSEGPANDRRRHALLRFGGVEADLWPDYLNPRPVSDDDLFASTDQLELVRTLYQGYCLNHPGLQLKFCIVLDNFREPEASPPSGFHRAGIDYGILQSRYNAYSSILSDVVLGSLSELIRFRSQINEELLFENLRTLEFFHRTRNRLLAEGAAVENSDPCFPIVIYSYSPNIDQHEA